VKKEDLKGVYKFEKACGRMGDLEGVFVSDQKTIYTLINEKLCVYFGEVLGKHSEVYTTISEKDINLLTNDSSFVDLFSEHIGSTGFNPLDYGVINYDYEGNGITVEDGWDYSELSADEIIEQLLKK
jgi:hypothetical protein